MLFCITQNHRTAHPHPSQHTRVELTATTLTIITKTYTVHPFSHPDPQMCFCVCARVRLCLYSPANQIPNQRQSFYVIAPADHPSHDHHLVEVVLGILVLGVAFCAHSTDAALAGLKWSGGLRSPAR